MSKVANMELASTTTKAGDMETASNTTTAIRSRKRTETLSGLSAMAEWIIVKNYLELLHSPLHKGREFRNPAQQLVTIDTELQSNPDLVKKLELIQRRIDILEFMESREQQENNKELEEKFVAIAKSYSHRKKISYTAWREMGVPASVLKAAHIDAERRPRTTSR